MRHVTTKQLLSGNFEIELGTRDYGRVFCLSLKEKNAFYISFLRYYAIFVIVVSWVWGKKDLSCENTQNVRNSHC